MRPSVYGQGVAQCFAPYEVAKAPCTYYGLMVHKLYRVPVAILRTFMTYGLG